MRPKLTFLAIAAVGLFGGAALVRAAAEKLNAAHTPSPEPQRTDVAERGSDADPEGRKLAADILDARQKAVDEARAGQPGPVYFVGGPTTEGAAWREAPKP